MPKPRVSAPDTTYHVMSHAVADLMLFGDDHERERFLKILAEAKETFAFKLYAYCLMSTHFHLLIRTGATGISEIMQSVLTRYAWLYNARRERRGYVVDGRFLSPIIDSQAYAMEVVRYINNNPVKAGIVTKAAHWPWSGHAELFEPDSQRNLTDARETLSWFGSNRRDALSEYSRFLEKDSAGEDQKIEEALHKPEAALEFADFAIEPVSMDELARRICFEAGIAVDVLRGESSLHSISKLRKDFVVEAVRSGNRPVAISRFLGRSKGLISRFLAEASREKKVNSKRTASA